MNRLTTVLLAALLAAVLLFVSISISPLEARGARFDYERVAVFQCRADDDGRIRVSGASVTYETPTYIAFGDDCADTISRLFVYDLRMTQSQAVASDETGQKVTFTFVFLGQW